MHRIAIISPDTSEEIRENLTALDIEPVPIPRTGLVQGPISGHPDIQLFVHGNRVFCHPGIDTGFLDRIEGHADVTICATRLSKEYPGDVAYNIACTGTHAFHHHDVIDPAVRDYLLGTGVIPCGVSQGYSKCSTMIVGERAIVTADASIHAAALAAGLAPLLIRPGYIDLPGYEYGFIGGASGLDGDAVLVAGTLYHHPDYEAIAAYIVAQGKRIALLGRGRAVDIGSIFVL